MASTGFLHARTPCRTAALTALTTALLAALGAAPPAAAETGPPALVPDEIPVQAYALIKFWEGKVSEKDEHGEIIYPAYRGAGGKWIVCYGHASENVTRDSMVLSEEGCDTLLHRDLLRFGEAIADAVTVPLNDNQYAALLSFSFNVGDGNFRRSTVLRLLNEGDYAGAAEALTHWDKVKVGDESRSLPGLSKRRAAEMALFLADDHETVPASLAADDPVRDILEQVVDGPVITDNAGFAAAAIPEGPPRIIPVTFQVGTRTDRSPALALGEHLVGVDIGTAGFVEFRGVSEEAGPSMGDRLFYVGAGDEEVARRLAEAIADSAGAGCRIDITEIRTGDAFPGEALPFELQLTAGSPCLPGRDES